VKRFDCGLIGKELCVARDSEHHYLIKFILKEGKWRMNKRGAVRVKGCPFPKITMTMGYYKEQVELRMRLKESTLNILMEMASSG
jgi:hypothetical protein